MIKADFMDKLLDGVEVERKMLVEVSKVLRGRRLTRDQLSDAEKFPVFHGGLDPLGYYGLSNRPAHTVMVINVGASAGTVGYSAVDFWSSDGCFCIQHSDLLNNKFLYYFLIGQQHLLRSRVRVAGIPTLDAIVVGKIPIPIPPLKVQEEIVRILDAFTEITAELIAELTNRKKQYTYYRDKLLTFEEGEVEWKSLGEIGGFVRGNGLQKSDFAESGVGCIHYGQIYTYYGNFAYQTKSFVSPTLATKLRKAQKGDLIIATTSENIEDVCKPLVWLGEDEVCVSGETYVFKHNQNPKYLAYYLQTPMFFDYKKQNRTGTKVIRVHGDKLKKFEIPIPPLTEQERIVTILDKFYALTSSITEGLPREIELRQKQYEYYRNMLLSFPKEEVEE